MTGTPDGPDVFVVSRLPIHAEGLLRALSRFSSPRWVGRRVSFRADLLRAPVLLAAELVGLFEAYRSRSTAHRPVVVVQFVSMDSVAAYLFRAFTGCRVLLYAVGSDVMGSEGALRRALLAWTLRRADFVVCANRSMEARVRSLGARDAETLPTPFTESSAGPARDKTYDLVSVGDLSELKRQRLLIASLDYVARPVKVALVGEGPLRGELEAESRRHPEAEVEFLGRVPPGRVKDILSMSRVYVQCSSREGIPRSVLEAASAGLPLVVMGSEYVRDLVELYGFRLTVVHDQKASALGEALRDTLDRYQSASADARKNVEAMASYSRQWSARAEEIVRALA